MSAKRTTQTLLVHDRPPDAVCVICESPEVTHWWAAGRLGNDVGARRWFCIAHWALSKRVMGAVGEALICDECPLHRWKQSNTYGG